jgi:hypothetical protein
MLRIPTLLIVLSSLAGCAGQIAYTGPATQAGGPYDKTVAQPLQRVWT